jgi:hypothetical protein
MGRAAEDELPSTGSAVYDRLVNEHRAWLAEPGETIVGSGCFRSGSVLGSLHCDFGPPGQDKRVNQDYALAWLPAKSADRRLPRLVVALSDGLTNSYRSECAAALACWTSVRSLIEMVAATSPKDRALFAFNEAGRIIGAMGDELSRDPEVSCPEGQFISTWKYILNKGALFQTTLTLAWLDDRLHLAMVGDGGALWRCHEGPRGADRVLAACNLDSQQVHALGPAERHIGDFDCWREETIDGPFLCALFTDGVGRGIGKSPLTLLDSLDGSQAAGKENAARRFIENAIRERPKEFDDNVTLAVIRGQGAAPKSETHTL